MRVAFLTPSITVQEKGQSLHRRTVQSIGVRRRSSSGRLTAVDLGFKAPCFMGVLKHKEVTWCSDTCVAETKTPNPLKRECSDLSECEHVRSQTLTHGLSEPAEGVWSSFVLATRCSPVEVKVSVCRDRKRKSTHSRGRVVSAVRHIGT